MHEPSWAQNWDAQGVPSGAGQSWWQGIPLTDEQDAGFMQQVLGQVAPRVAPHVSRASEDLQGLTPAPPGAL